jgi:hypothetical protein
MASKIASRHIKMSLAALAAGIAVSALTSIVPRPNPIWVDGKQFLPSAFSAHDNGTPLPFIHTSCYGDPLGCHSTLDPWGFILNSLVWAIVFVSLCMALQALRKRFPKRKRA